MTNLNQLYHLRTDQGKLLTVSIIAAPFFFGAFFADEKNEPKKLGSSFLGSTSRSLLLLIAALPFFSGGGLVAFKRSVTIDMAFTSVNTITMPTNMQKFVLCDHSRSRDASC